VLEHYVFAVGTSAVRIATLKHTQSARVKLEAEYAQPFRELPTVGQYYVITQADGTIICTVQAGSGRFAQPVPVR
jgi:hypothetical protein